MLWVVRRMVGRYGRHIAPVLPRWRSHHPGYYCIAPRGGHCWSCHHDTPLIPVYVACYECGHGYRTRLHLLARHWRMDWVGRRFTPRRWWPFHWISPERIYTCPCCSHDF